ncbi:hypothetical protein GHT06_005946 [Daphnia sinensis]|uniref:CCHC-type domain-containing protein n=1 Tax=Daphnia sinensis TaxID=1820382 RepID=A0AAD5KEY7_9CRUS|nr:hypothetical protein GHT06_005946 [Daphnia sinensis]
MANVQDLVDAIALLTAQFRDQQAQQNINNAAVQQQLQQALTATNDLVTALAGAAGGGGAGGGGGGPDESPDEFVARVVALATTEGWDDGQRIQVAVRRLGPTVADWHVRVGNTHAAWNDWSAAFRTAFATKISLTDWTSKMVARVQQPGESIMQYAMAKEKLLAMAPVALTDQQKVQALTEGLRSWQHQAAVMSTNPANVAAFYTACNNLPTSLAAPAAEKPTKSADPVDPSAALEAVANRLVNDLAARLEKIVISKNEGVSGYGAGTGATGRPRGGEAAGRGRGSGGATAAPGVRFVPVSDRKCFNCDVKGHLAKDCPSPKK